MRPHTARMAKQRPQPAVKIHSLVVRVTHWLNALAVVIMILSGWRIYNASPLFDFIFPAELTLGGWLGGALQWHFAAMWLLVLNGLVYLATGRVWRVFARLSLRELRKDIDDALHLRLSHEDISTYNSLQKLAYLGAVALVVVVVASGLVIWKSVQFPLLRELMGGYEGARLVHFFAMCGIVAFIIIHVTMALAVPKTFIAMTGLGRRR